jgi:2-dehydropantoate 2-reductase
MTAQKLKRNYVYLHQAGIKLSPKKMHLFRLVPVKVITVLLGYVYQSKFGDLFMYRHAMKAQEEMHDLHREFYEIIITS